MSTVTNVDCLEAFNCSVLQNEKKKSNFIENNIFSNKPQVNQITHHNVFIQMPFPLSTAIQMATFQAVGNNSSPLS